MKQGPSSPALSDQEIIRAWKWKRRAIYPCVAVGVVLLIAGFLLRENDTGMPLLVAGAIFGIAARELNTACRRCPRCGSDHCFPFHALSLLFRRLLLCL